MDSLKSEWMNITEIPCVCPKTATETGIIVIFFSVMVLLSVIIGLFGILFCVIIYLVCGKYKGKWKTSHEDLTALDEERRVVRNPCFDYNEYRERAAERELHEVRGFERERTVIRNRSLVENNLARLQHVVLIPPNVETETDDSVENLIQDNTVSSTTNDGELQPLHLRVFSFFRSLF